MYKKPTRGDNINKSGLNHNIQSEVRNCGYCFYVGKKTLNKWLRNGMPVYKVGRLVRVRRSEFDAWMKQFSSGTSQDLDTIWDQVMEEVER